MGEESLAVVRRVYDHWREGDFTFRDLLDPDVLFVMNPGFPDPGKYAGIEELASYTRQFLQPWVRLTIDAEELIDAGDMVVAAVRQAAVGEGSGVPSEFRYFTVWTVRDGKVIRFENFRERADALRAAGLG